MTAKTDLPEGSSPLTRGKQARGLPPLRAVGLIPAHAGKTRRGWMILGCRRAHPRSRGENRMNCAQSIWSCGSSPLTRGKPEGRDIPGFKVGLIPAHAGKTDTGGVSTYGHGAHPRSRGENCASNVARKPSWGSSPLTRGKRWVSSVERFRLGLIPAHAGKTRTWRSTSPPAQAHPRSRGENVNDVGAALAARGSSPLTRGKPCPPRRASAWTGLIPAHAGKTDTGGVSTYGHGAHPRSRGENATTSTTDGIFAGSSPLTRGKQSSGCPGARLQGLIPAHAGKTVI